MPDLNQGRRAGVVTVWAAVAVLTVVRLGLIGAVGLGDDEAYYWEWSRRLAASYYDHPPGVAWLIAASTRLLGDSAFAVRSPSVLAGVVAGAALWHMAREIVGERAAGLALLAFHLAPMFGIITVFAAPDMPMLAAWAVAMWGAWRALGGARWGWVVAGVGAGLAGLCKYNAVLLPIGLLCAMLTRREWRAWLRRWEPWAAAGVALLLVLPVLVWNAQHQQVSFAFHLSGRHHAGDPLTRGGQFLGSQLALVSPVVLVAALMGLRRQAWVAWAALPTLLLFFVVSPLTDFKPHWTAAGWMFALLGAGAWLEGRRWCTRLGLALAGLTTAAVYLQAVAAVVPLPARADPTNDLVGWDRVGERVVALWQASPSRDRTFACGHMYQNAAQLAFATRGSGMAVVRLGDRVDEYDQWRRDEALRGQDAFFVAHDKYWFDASAHARDLGFLGCERVETLPVERRGDVVRTFTIWRCRNFG